MRDPPQYEPPSELDAFLKAGPAPIYVGFGSIVIDNPESLLKMVVDAVTSCGVRAIISKGWSNLKSVERNENVFYIGDCPHG